METFDGLFLPLEHNAPPFWGFLLHFRSLLKAPPVPEQRSRQFGVEDGLTIFYLLAVSRECGNIVYQDYNYGMI